MDETGVCLAVPGVRPWTVPGAEVAADLEVNPELA